MSGVLVAAMDRGGVQIARVIEMMTTPAAM